MDLNLRISVFVLFLGSPLAFFSLLRLKPIQSMPRCSSPSSSSVKWTFVPLLRELFGMMLMVELWHHCRVGSWCYRAAFELSVGRLSCALVVLCEVFFVNSVALWGTKAISQMISQILTSISQILTNSHIFSHFSHFLTFPHIFSHSLTFSHKSSQKKKINACSALVIWGISENSGKMRFCRLE